MTRRYYAAQSPRGFANEWVVYAFASKAQRDSWVEEHEDDGDINAAAEGGRAVTAREARQLDPTIDNQPTVHRWWIPKEGS
jgi:hypothetical protein